MTTFICNGPRVFVKDRRDALASRIADAAERLKAAPKGGKAPLAEKLSQLRAALAAFKSRADEEYIERAGCGTDLSAQIEKIPDDGAVYEYHCMTCGNTGTVRKATPPVEAAA